MTQLGELKSSDLRGKTIFIRCDFNVPLRSTAKGLYRVADDTRIRRFLDLTFRKIHELTEGDCRIIIGSHLGRPHKTKDHSGWDGIFNIQFVSSHFDTLIRRIYGDTYTIFPPETIDSHMQHSLEIVSHRRLPPGGIKFLPNLRYMLDPKNTDLYRTEFITKLADIADVYINCAFGCSHRITKSIKLLPQLMRQKGKQVIAGVLLYEEINRIGKFASRILSQPKKTLVVAGGAKISDKIEILKQFVLTGIKGILIGGKMANAFLLAQQQKELLQPFNKETLPAKLISQKDSENEELLNEINLAEEIIELAEVNKVSLLFPEDYKVVTDYQSTTFENKSVADFSKELQLDLGEKTINQFEELFKGIQNVFWNGPLGAYDHPACSYYAEGSLELAKMLFQMSLTNEELSVVIGGGDSAAILNKIGITELKKMIKAQIEKQFPSTVNRNQISIDFLENDSYQLWNYFASNFFVSTGGGASLQFLHGFLKEKAKGDMASYLPGTATLMELCEI
ncbi:MAG: phosphoglycerate kinase [Nitrospinae bacterium]|nr:phosphoglycerate kinase [Nitrospinota bacterium]MZH41288.1 phosphoglycerate kinase [Nitrospinota bacterium]